MIMEKTSRVSLVEQVVSQMEKLIQSGAWPVGSRIPPETELMQQLGVSRNTLREAVRALVHAGLLQTKQGSGTIVCSASLLGAAMERRIQQATLLETLEVRQALEREAASLAAVRRSDEDLAECRLHLNACRAAAEAKDRHAYAKSDILLHKAIVRASHNRMLIELYEQMTDALQTSIREIVALTPSSDIQAHMRVVDAIARQDEEEAIEAVREYIEQFIQTASRGEAEA